MKKTLFFILALALTASCVKPGFEFDRASVTTSAGGKVTGADENTISVYFTDLSGTASVPLTATAEWNAEIINDRAAGWCKVSPASGGKGSFTLNVSVSANDGDEDRSATVKVSCGEVVRSIIITQKQKDALIVTSGKIELPSEGGIAEIKVKSNVRYEYTIDGEGKAWVSPLQTKALTESTLVFKVEENQELEKREATVTIKSGSLSEQVKIYQEGAKPAIIISKNDYAVHSDGGEIRVEVSSNVNVECSIPSDCGWIRESLTKSMSTNTFVFAVDRNESYDNRYAEITFTNRENQLSEKIFVTQAQKDAIVIACQRYELDYHGGELNIEVGHNVEFDYRTDVDWISEITTKSFTTEGIRFKVEMNESDSPREGIIRFTSADGVIVQDVKVCQGQADMIIISDLEKNVSDRGETFSIEIKSNIGYSYRIEQSGNWLHDITTKALTSRTLTFKADPNNNYDPREACIVVTSDDGEFTGTVKVTQMQKDAIVVANSRYDIGSEGGSISVKVGSNVDYTTEIDGSWIHETTTKAFIEKTLRFTVDEYTGDDPREGRIIFRSADGKLSQTVKVIQDKLGKLIVGETLKNVASTGGTVSFEVKSNTEYSWTITAGGSWLHDATTKGMTSKTLSFRADANTNYDSRTATIVVRTADGKLSETVTVTQFQKDAILAEHDSYTINNEGGDIKIAVNSNVSYAASVTEGEDWLTIVQTKSMTSSTVTVKVSANPSGDNREGKISLAATDGSLSETVTIIQKKEEVKSVLAITHNVKTGFAIPVLAGSKLSGTIDWGDGESGDYASGAAHSYSSSGTYTVTITTTKADGFSTGVTGVSVIDLSKF